MGKKKDRASLEIVVAPRQTAFASSGGVAAVTAKARSALDDLADDLRAASAGFASVLAEVGPDEVTLELSLTLEGETKWIIVSGKAAATASVTMTWKKRGS